MGFGLWALVNIQKCVDKMELDFALGKGTKLVMRIVVPPEPGNSQRLDHEPANHY